MEGEKGLPRDLSPDFIPEAHDLHDVGYRMASAEISVAADRVGIILRIGFHQEGLLYVAVPDLRIAAVFSGEGDGVVDVAYSGVVGGQHELHALSGVGHFPGQRAVEVGENPRGGGDVGLRVFDAVEGESVSHGRAGHNLHYSPCAGPGDKIAVESALDISDGGQQTPVTPGGARIGPEDGVVGGDGPFREVEAESFQGVGASVLAQLEVALEQFGLAPLGGFLDEPGVNRAASHLLPAATPQDAFWGKLSGRETSRSR